MITGAELLIKAKLDYYTTIENLDGEVIDYVKYDKIWIVMDAVMINDSLLIVVGLYQPTENSPMSGVFVIEKKIKYYTKVEEMKENEKKEKIIQRIGKNKFKVEGDRVIVYDVLGRKVLESEEKIIDLGNLPSSVYFCIIRRRNDYFIEKVLIIK